MKESDRHSLIVTTLTIGEDYAEKKKQHVANVERRMSEATANGWLIKQMTDHSPIVHDPEHRQFVEVYQGNTLHRADITIFSTLIVYVQPEQEPQEGFTFTADELEIMLSTVHNDIDQWQQVGKRLGAQYEVGVRSQLNRRTALWNKISEELSRLHHERDGYDPESDPTDPKP